MPPDRLVQALPTHEAINCLIVADPFRSGPSQFARRMLGRGPVAFPTGPTAALVSPMRLRREDSVGRRRA